VSRLEDLNIRRMVEGPAVTLYVRDNCIAAVGNASGGSLGQGSTGMMTDQGLTYLVWRDGRPYLSGKNGEAPATPEQVAAIQKFSEDLKDALSS